MKPPYTYVFANSPNPCVNFVLSSTPAHSPVSRQDDPVAGLSLTPSGVDDHGLPGRVRANPRLNVFCGTPTVQSPVMVNSPTDADSTTIMWSPWKTFNRASTVGF